MPPSPPAQKQNKSCAIAELLFYMAEMTDDGKDSTLFVLNAIGVKFWK